MKLATKQAKSILTPSKLPGADYVVNPYSGCAFGCVYCYAEFTRKFTGHMDDEWGKYVDAKINTPEVFEKEIANLTKKVIKENEFKTGNRPVIFFGSVTDPYQGVEAKYELTKKCLEIITRSDINNEIEISLLTKSPLVTRDIELLKQISNLEVGMTISSIDDNISRIFECYAPPSSLRILALKKLNEAGIKTYAFVGPLLPHFVANEESLRKLFMEIRDSGTKKVWAEHLNLSWGKLSRLIEKIGDQLTDDELKLFKESQTDEYKTKLSNMILGIVKELGLELVGGKVVDHIKLTK
jgi:DNA repair photolyase